MAKIGNITTPIVDEQFISDLPDGTLVKWKGELCIWSWAGLAELTGRYFWSRKLVEDIKMRGEVLPFGTVIELIQK
jgi:hypothetical protein